MLNPTQKGSAKHSWKNAQHANHQPKLDWKQKKRLGGATKHNNPGGTVQAYTKHNRSPGHAKTIDQSPINLLNH